MMKMSMFKKLLLGFLASIVLLISIVPYFSAAHAQTWYNQPFEEWTDKVFNENNPEEIFGERYAYAQVEWIIYSVIAFLTFAGDQEVFGCLLRTDGDLEACRDEIIAAASGFLTSSETTNNLAESNNLFLAGFTTRPVSGIAYFKDIAERANLVPEVSAQGFGFSAANPILGLWRMVRNVTYFLLILVIIVMSFMIMFRVKTSPQTAITVQSALPKIIVALILITFSYAIAGLLIDLMYVVIGLVAGIISSSGLVGGDYTDWITMYNALTTERSIFVLLGQFMLTFYIGLFIALFSSGAVGFSLGILATLFSPLIVLILAIVMLFAWFKILWLLFKTFAMILLQIVVGPIMILLGAFGVGGGFSLWLRNLIAHLAVYPAVGFMFIMSFVFLRGAFFDREGDVVTPFLDSLFPFGVQQTLSGSTWTPPLTVGSTQVELLWLIASLAVLLLIPQVANIIRGMIEKRPFQYGTAIGAALAAGAGVATYPIRETAGLTSETFRKGFVEVMQTPTRKFWEKVTGIRNP